MACAGDWEAGRQRDAANPGLAADHSDDESPVYGDFEDMEAAAQLQGSADPATAAALQAMQEEASAQRREAAKSAKKAAFNEAYDQGKHSFIVFAWLS